jgi:hypothetical protein
VTPDATAVSGAAAVDAFFGTFRHPRKDAFLALRAIILGADAAIAEGIKWNVPSFRTTEWFATLHVRGNDGVQVIMHLGARTRGRSAKRVEDPAKLLTWLGPDRALATFRDLEDVRARRKAYQALIREWITCL